MSQSFDYSSNSRINSETVTYEKNNNDSRFVTTATTNNKPNDIFALARAFLSIGSMTHKKLQKLCYYAKAWYLALYDTNLVKENFEAWVHGAVQPDLYQRYRSYGYSDIPKEADTSNIPDEFLSFAKEVFQAYGHLSGDELERLNHREKPWIEARGNTEPWANSRNVISELTMKEYYRERLQ